MRAKRQAAGMCPQCGAPMEELGGKMVCSVSCKARRMTLIAYACCMFCREVFVSRSMGEVSSLCRKPECQRKMAAIRNKRHTPSPAAKERARAGVRAHGHARRAGVSDITPEQEMAMRAAARNCPLCGVRMTDVPYLPNSKHLDHIVPINQGGTHTLGNVRILCCRCNVRRPADGSDYTGPLTLWAQIPATSRPVRRSGNRNKETCRSGLHPWTPENIVELYGQRSCGPCIELHRPGYLAKAGTNRSMIKGAEARMETARQIRAMQAGGMSLREIARQLGYRDSKPVRNMLAELAAVEYA